MTTQLQQAEEALEKLAKYPSTRADEMSAAGMREVARAALAALATVSDASPSPVSVQPSDDRIMELSALHKILIPSSSLSEHSARVTAFARALLSTQPAQPISSEAKEPQSCPEDAIKLVQEYGDARADGDWTLSGRLIGQIIKAIREFRASPAPDVRPSVQGVSEPHEGFKLVRVEAKPECCNEGVDGSCCCNGACAWKRETEEARKSWNALASQPAVQGASDEEMLRREIHNLKRHIEDYCQPAAPQQEPVAANAGSPSICNDDNFMAALDGYMDAVTNEQRNTERRIKQRLAIFAAADAWCASHPQAAQPQSEQAATADTDAHDLRQLLASQPLEAGQAKLRATLYAIAHTLDDHELRQAAKEAYEAIAQAAPAVPDVRQSVAASISEALTAYTKSNAFAQIEWQNKTGAQIGFNHGYAAVINCVAPSAPSASAPIGLETGWLVENGKQGDELRYRTMESGLPEWTADPNKAIRFARRIDAEWFAQEDEDAWAIVQHAWHDRTVAAPSVSADSQDAATADLLLALQTVTAHRDTLLVALENDAVRLLRVAGYLMEGTATRRILDAIANAKRTDLPAASAGDLTKLREAVMDAAVEWAVYVEVDTAPRTCSEHIGEAFDKAAQAIRPAAKGAGGQESDAAQSKKGGAA